MKEHEQNDIWSDKDELEYQIGFDMPVFKENNIGKIRTMLAEDVELGIISLKEAKQIEMVYLIKKEIDDKTK